MQEKLTTARPYALAAFRHAVEARDVDAWSRMLAKLAAVVAQPDLHALIGHPRVTVDKLGGILGEALAGELNAHRQNFLDVLLAADRLELAPEIAELFERHKAAAAGVVAVSVESAFELTSEQRDNIAQAVASRFGRDCELEARTKPELIGGAVIKIGDSVIDLSLRGRLRALEQRLT